MCKDVIKDGQHSFLNIHISVSQLVADEASAKYYTAQKVTKKSATSVDITTNSCKAQVQFSAQTNPNKVKHLHMHGES